MTTIAEALERRRAEYLALPAHEQKALVFGHAWRCACLAAGRRLVKSGQYGRSARVADIAEDIEVDDETYVAPAMALVE